jgi:hypothetical protein
MCTESHVEHQKTALASTNRYRRHAVNTGTFYDLHEHWTLELVEKISLRNVNQIISVNKV